MVIPAFYFVWGSFVAPAPSAGRFMTASPAAELAVDEEPSELAVPALLYVLRQETSVAKVP